ncbi:hypothetical protein GCM10011344_36130 [Dokdonia pacifica]|uniref:Uncharacterized protein n=1 Tax=Dokdonia pacifica TaxID=1627892 RepID=A0A239AVI3_9FLAO|nr:hypothetical protein [Dokdonia pacifica]GGG31968.1 hypothetical protein GCM10011344_36130 [Dokdonia pacifica]SNR99580.1 hypothetical protein SAMN06265376_105160 [Dokdonia pacifica]
METKHKRRLGILAIIGTILLIPLIAMQFTNEVRWTLADFVVAGVLLLGVGSIVEVIILKIQNRNYKTLLYIALIIVFLLLWAELAVGIFDSPLAGS